MSEIFASTRNTRAVLPDSLRFIRSDVPTGISPEEALWLRNQGVRTVIDLRQPSERLRKPCPLETMAGFDYRCMPVTGGDALPASPEEVPLSYMRMADDAMEHILDSILKADGGVLYFCNAGKDRTGVVTAMLLRRLGYDDEYIIKDYLKSAENLKEMLESYARSHPETRVETLMPRRETMERFLAWLR